MVLITGPTGSGKTTTLYSALNARRTPELNAVTVEDPIEYHLDGITQVQVQPDSGSTYATILRALLRQDPDIIMVGEIRDRETAQMAIEAAMTGHLVLASAHANGAAESILRLIDLGVDRVAIANGLRGVLNQRLVRRICQRCAEPFDYPDPIIDVLRRVGALPANETFSFKRGQGCDHCKGSGFRGRAGLFEILGVTELVREAILAGEGVNKLQHLAADVGITLSRYAGVLIQSGITAPSEVVHLLQPVEG
ncbi:MAG: hypothetical protein NVS3B20_08790 [Polyangiales bacterium]